MKIRLYKDGKAAVVEVVSVEYGPVACITKLENGAVLRSDRYTGKMTLYGNGECCKVDGIDIGVLVL